METQFFISNFPWQKFLPGKKNVLYFALFYIAFSGVLGSCEPLEVEPPNDELTSELVFTDDATAEATVLGLYSSMMFDSGFASGDFGSITMLAGLAGDDFISNTGTVEMNEFLNASIIPTNAWLEYFLWNTGYMHIYHCNAILEGLELSIDISEDLKKRLEGETRFLRAFFYFYLVNMFGEVPLNLSTDYKVNSIAGRTATNEIYGQIVNDLLMAGQLLPENYSLSANERVRANKWASKALLARVYLYLEEWEKAEAFSTEVISEEGLFQLVALEEVFLKNSSEAIWQLQPVSSGYNTKEGASFIAFATSPNFVSLSEELLHAFEVRDLRRQQWVGELVTTERTHHYPFKYKISFGSELVEYSMVLRLAEQYLIRAEARARQGKTELALSDLNLIRSRSGLDNVSVNDPDLLLEAIYKERRIELFSEWGHRWFDLKRTGRAEGFLSPLKPDWSPEMLLFPIPQKELLNNPNMNQNPGY